MIDQDKLNHQRLADGRWPFGIPMGYKEGEPFLGYTLHKDGPRMRKRRQVMRTITIDPSTAPIIEEIFHLYANERKTVRFILQYLHIKYEIYKKWGSGIDNILMNKFYYGCMEWQGVEYTHSYGNIITKELFDKAQLIREQRRKKSEKRETKHNFPFRRLIKCHECDCFLTASVAKKKYVYYHCSFAKGRHPFKRISIENLFDWMRSSLAVLDYGDFPQSLNQESDEYIFLTNFLQWHDNARDEHKDIIPSVVFKSVTVVRGYIEAIPTYVRNLDPDKVTFAVDHFLKRTRSSAVINDDNLDGLLPLDDKILKFCRFARSIDEIMAKLGVDLHEIQMALMDLQLEGLIDQSIQGTWKRK